MYSNAKSIESPKHNKIKASTYMLCVCVLTLQYRSWSEHSPKTPHRKCWFARLIHSLGARGNLCHSPFCCCGWQMAWTRKGLNMWSCERWFIWKCNHHGGIDMLRWTLLCRCRKCEYMCLWFDYNYVFCIFWRKRLTKQCNSAFNLQPDIKFHNAPSNEARKRIGTTGIQYSLFVSFSLNFNP